MPSQQRVAVDSTPKLHGIWDTINSTIATPGPPTHLPPEFYDAKVRSIVDHIVTEEEYAGFKENNEYRTNGIGALLGEVVRRMVRSCPESSDFELSAREEKGVDTANDRNTDLKIALFGCHDSTLAAILASLGVLEGQHHTWPSFTSSLAIELFRDVDRPARFQREGPIKPLSTEASRQYIRMRYNDSPVVVPGCRLPGRHLAGDESFCTLVSPPSPHAVFSNLPFSSFPFVSFSF